MNKFTPISIILIALIALGGRYAYIKQSQKPAFELVAVQKANLTEEVDATGNVKPAENADLAFETSGRVVKIPFKVGDKIKVGQTLMVINGAVIAANLSQAEAKLQSAEADLNELLRGARQEDIQVAETKVQNTSQALSDSEANLNIVKNKAEIDLNNIYDGVKNILNEAYVYADDALNNQINPLFVNDNDPSPQLTFSTDLQIESDTEFARLLAGLDLQKFKIEIVNLLADQIELDAELIKTEGHLITIRDLMDKLITAVERSTGLSQGTITSYLDDINTGRVNMNTYLNKIAVKKQDIAAQKITNQKNINTAETTVSDNRRALKLAEDELKLKKAGPTPEQIASKEALVRQAEANLKSYQAEWNKTALRSPINGTIAKQDIKVGEIASANTIVISLISEAKFEIEANIPEADIAKIKIGNFAKITLDAYGNELFEAQVIAIEPAETIVGGMPTYKTTFQFAKEDERIKSGMTANLTIKTDERQNILVIPRRTIIKQNGEAFVYIPNPDKPKEKIKKIITVGLYGYDGNVEILNGLTENEQVIIPKD